MKKTQDAIYFFIVVALICIIAYQGLIIQDYNEASMLQGGDIQKAELQDSVKELSITVKRYELALDFLRDKDSAAAFKFENELYTIE